VTAIARRHPGWAGFGAVLALGIAARVALSFTTGHWDVGWYLTWTRILGTQGLAGLYHGPTANCDYPPLYVLGMRGLGAVWSWFDPSFVNEAALRVWLRLPACLADVAIAAALFIEGRRLLSPRGSVAAAALYFLNPATLYISAYWGQTDSVHSCFVLLACVALNRWRPTLGGVAIALAVLQKLQAVTFLPLVLLDLYRQKRWRGLAGGVLGMLVTSAVVLTPFAATGTVRDVLTRGYVNVVGQYPYRSFYAFNLWYMTSDAGARDDTLPAFLLPAVTHDAPLDGGHWIAFFTWRRLGLGLFALAVAGTLAAYSRCSSPAARSLAAGVLALAFFLLPTQMHERYQFPVLAVLPLWVIGGPWRERVYVLVSVLFLLNLTLVLPVGAASGQMAVLSLIIGGALLVALFGAGLAATRHSAAKPVVADAPGLVATVALLEQPEPLEPSRLVGWFRRLTVVAAVAVVLAGGFVVAKNLWPRGGYDSGGVYLSTLRPVRHSQGYGRLHFDSSIDGSALHVGGRLYPRGVGTHAPFELVYDLPPGYSRFVATIGLNASAAGLAEVRVLLDDQSVHSTGPLRASSQPAAVDIPLMGARQLKLVGLDLGDKTGDHVDLADARLER
jgi:Gpi18-like mannosyltransferase